MPKIRKEAPGALTFCRIAENAVQGPEVYTEENFMILLELALNRPLKMVEKQVARDASAILRYALDRDDEDVDLTGLIQERQAEYAECRKVKTDRTEFIRAKQNADVILYRQAAVRDDRQID